MLPVAFVTEKADETVGPNSESSEESIEVQVPDSPPHTPTSPSYSPMRPDMSNSDQEKDGSFSELQIEVQYSPANPSTSCPMSPALGLSSPVYPPHSPIGGFTPQLEGHESPELLEYSPQVESGMSEPEYSPQIESAASEDEASVVTSSHESPELFENPSGGGADFDGVKAEDVSQSVEYSPQVASEVSEPEYSPQIEHDVDEAPTEPQSHGSDGDTESEHSGDADSFIEDEFVKTECVENGDALDEDEEGYDERDEGYDEEFYEYEEDEYEYAENEYEYESEREVDDSELFENELDDENSLIEHDEYSSSQFEHVKSEEVHTRLATASHHTVKSEQAGNDSAESVVKDELVKSELVNENDAIDNDEGAHAESELIKGELNDSDELGEGSVCNSEDQEIEEDEDAESESGDEDVDFESEHDPKDAPEGEPREEGGDSAECDESESGDEDIEMETFGAHKRSRAERLYAKRLAKAEAEREASEDEEITPREPSQGEVAVDDAKLQHAANDDSESEHSDVSARSDENAEAESESSDNGAESLAEKDEAPHIVKSNDGSSILQVGKTTSTAGDSFGSKLATNDAKVGDGNVCAGDNKDATSDVAARGEANISSGDSVVTNVTNAVARGESDASEITEGIEVTEAGIAVVRASTDPADLCAERGARHRREQSNVTASSPSGANGATSDIPVDQEPHLDAKNAEREQHESVECHSDSPEVKLAERETAGAFCGSISQCEEGEMLKVNVMKDFGVSQGDEKGKGHAKAAALKKGRVRALEESEGEIPSPVGGLTENRNNDRVHVSVDDDATVESKKDDLSQRGKNQIERSASLASKTQENDNELQESEISESTSVSNRSCASNAGIGGVEVATDAGRGIDATENVTKCVDSDKQSLDHCSANTPSQSSPGHLSGKIHPENSALSIKHRHATSPTEFASSPPVKSRSLAAFHQSAKETLNIATSSPGADDAHLSASSTGVKCSATAASSPSAKRPPTATSSHQAGITTSSTHAKRHKATASPDSIGGALPTSCSPQKTAIATSHCTSTASASPPEVRRSRCRVVSHRTRSPSPLSDSSCDSDTAPSTRRKPPLPTATRDSNSSIRPCAPPTRLASGPPRVGGNSSYESLTPSSSDSGSTSLEARMLTASREYTRRSEGRFVPRYCLTCFDLNSVLCQNICRESYPVFFKPARRTSPIFVALVAQL